MELRRSKWSPFPLSLSLSLSHFFAYTTRLGLRPRSAVSWAKRLHPNIPSHSEKSILVHHLYSDAPV